MSTPEEQAMQPVPTAFEFYPDIDPENGKATEFLPDGVGVLLVIAPGDETPTRLVMKSGLPLVQVERVLMNALIAIDTGWRDGDWEEAGENVNDRDQRMTLKTWSPWGN